MEENNGDTVTIGVKRKIIEENHIPTFTHFEEEDSDNGSDTENEEIPESKNEEILDSDNDPKINKEIPDGSDSDDNEENPNDSDSDNNEEIPDGSDSEENLNDSDDDIDTRKKDGIRPIHVLFIFLAYFIFLMTFNILRYYGYESVSEFIQSGLATMILNGTLALGNNTMSLCRDL